MMGPRLDLLASHRGLRTWLGVLAVAAAMTAGAPASAAQLTLLPKFTWVEHPQTTAPAPRSGAAMAYDAARRTTILFGGAAQYRPDVGSPSLNDTWSWNGGSWTRLQPARSPSPRAFAAMAYDSVRRQIVLFGGLGSEADLGDTWTWDGHAWTRRSPAVSPPGGAWSMTFDSARGVAVLYAAGFLYGADWGPETWEWDGSTWVQRLPAHNPGYRPRAAMAFDAARGVTLLYGAVFYEKDYGTDAFGQNWVWDGNDWTVVATSSPAPDLVGAALAYDPVIREVAMFGGWSCPDDVQGPDCRDRSDTWLWDGSGWSHAPDDGLRPGRRASADLVYDVARDRFVLFGGEPGGLVAPSVGTPGPQEAPRLSANDTWLGYFSSCTSAPTLDPMAPSVSLNTSCPPLPTLP